MLRRILQGDPGKASRFRDFEGRLPPLGAWPYLLVSVASTLRLKLTGVRGAIPWLGYRATRRIAGLIGPGTRVLEFGSGLSTVWLAKQGAEVLSIETHDEGRRRRRRRHLMPVYTPPPTSYSSHGRMHKEVKNAHHDLRP